MCTQCMIIGRFFLPSTDVLQSVEQTARCKLNPIKVLTKSLPSAVEGRSKINRIHRIQQEWNSKARSSNRTSLSCPRRCHMLCTGLTRSTSHHRERRRSISKGFQSWVLIIWGR